MPYNSEVSELLGVMIGVYCLYNGFTKTLIYWSYVDAETYATIYAVRQGLLYRLTSIRSVRYDIST